MITARPLLEIDFVVALSGCRLRGPPLCGPAIRPPPSKRHLIDPSPSSEAFSEAGHAGQPRSARSTFWVKKLTELQAKHAHESHFISLHHDSVCLSGLPPWDLHNGNSIPQPALQNRHCLVMPEAAMKTNTINSHGILTSIHPQLSPLCQSVCSFQRRMQLWLFFCCYYLF